MLKGQGSRRKDTGPWERKEETPFLLQWGDSASPSPERTLSPALSGMARAWHTCLAGGHSADLSNDMGLGG